MCINLGFLEMMIGVLYGDLVKLSLVVLSTISNTIHVSLEVVVLMQIQIGVQNQSLTRKQMHIFVPRGGEFFPIGLF